MRIIAVLAVLTLSVAASADPPCHSRQVVSRHEQAIVVPQRVYPNAIHAATIFADTHLHVVEVPVPVYVFQTLTALQPAQVPQQVPQQTDAGIGTDDSLAALVGPAPDYVGEIRQKCASCHSTESGKSIGGLTLFDQAGVFQPTSTKQINRSLLAARARSTGADAMPPGSDTNPGKKLSDLAIRYLETGQ